MPLPPDPLQFFTPLRYPGGKGKLAPFIKSLIELNGITDGYYVEPYAGGAAVALELLFHEYVTHIYINDVSPSIGAFWRSVLSNSEALCARIRDTKVSMKEWHRQRQILQGCDRGDDLALGFATFFLNRTNRSGILKAGVIGGKKQLGEWKLDARYNVENLTRRIEAISKLRNRISFSQDDALAFVRNVASKLPAKTLVYLDPPYYLKGKDLYHHYYIHADHERIAARVPRLLNKQKWIVSYDDAPEIMNLYSAFKYVRYGLSYSAQARYKGGETMFFADGMVIPPLTVPMHAVA